MARSILFTTDPESNCHITAREDLLVRSCVPYRVRLQKFNEEKVRSRNEVRKEDWFKYCYDDYSLFRSIKKPLYLWIYDFVRQVESRVNFRGNSFSGNDQLSWEFAYYIYCSETEEAIRYSADVWFVKIKDKENQIVHPSWTIMLDREGDFTIKRGIATPEDSMSKKSFNFWDDSEKRITDAIYSYMRLRAFRLGHKSKK